MSVLVVRRYTTNIEEEHITVNGSVDAKNWISLAQTAIPEKRVAKVETIWKSFDIVIPDPSPAYHDENVWLSHYVDRLEYGEEGKVEVWVTDFQDNRALLWAHSNVNRAKAFELHIQFVTQFQEGRIVR